MAPIELIPSLRGELEAVGCARRAADNARYMKGRATYIGVPMGEVHRLGRPLVRAGRQVPAAELLDAADELWRQPEREFAYVAIDLLRRWVDRLGPRDLARVEHYLRTEPWWDTVDLLAARVVGPMVANHPALVATMDRWIDDDDIWIARTAILHQLGYRERTDAARLFDYVDRRCADTDVFIRKACGWALRAYAAIDPDGVRSYVDDRGDRLSGLTRREATKHL
jgi:3-methyladenine DNA glycosylase AlkD